MKIHKPIIHCLNFGKFVAEIIFTVIRMMGGSSYTPDRPTVNCSEKTRKWVIKSFLSIFAIVVLLLASSEISWVNVSIYSASTWIWWTSVSCTGLWRARATQDLMRCSTTVAYIAAAAWYGCVRHYWGVMDEAAGSAAILGFPFSSEIDRYQYQTGQLELNKNNTSVKYEFPPYGLTPWLSFPLCLGLTP